MKDMGEVKDYNGGGLRAAGQEDPAGMESAAGQRNPAGMESPAVRHGGDWASFERIYHKAPLDFSANVSPLGVPESILRAYREAAADADRYPDPECRALRACIADAEGVLPEEVICGNGASDLIWRAVLAVKPKRALVTAPCFGEYEAALRFAGCRVDHYPLGEDFWTGEDFPDHITGETDMVFLCQPNNPSGVSVPERIIRKTIEKCRASGALLVLDLCFAEFLEEPGVSAGVWSEDPGVLTGARFQGHGENVGFGENVLILKAFTKLSGMAGMRLGYALCSGIGLLKAMHRAGPPWNVSGPAQAAGIAALGEEGRAYTERFRAMVSAERPYLLRELSALGLRVIPGEANFLLFRGPEGLKTKLAEKGILIRSCGDFIGLSDDWYRCAVRTHEDNRRLVEAAGDILQGTR